MSDFVQQQQTICDFTSSGSWVILSPIEQSIKRKIEAVGTPLKDWNIQINYGIKTGFNDAFIINSEKREEILANCQTEEERYRTAELIRPILRGRDIKRYGYEWADLWIINTHNGIKGKLPRIDVNEYPAIKEHLDQYWDKISKRTDKGDTPYNLRNCAYMEDFNKPKIIWKIIGNRLGFALEKKNMILNNACYILTCDDVGLEYLEAMLNSNAILWYSFITNMNKTGVGDMQVGAQNINILPIPKYSQDKQTLCEYVNTIHNNNSPIILNKIESIICKIFGFSEIEQQYLLHFVRDIYQ